MTGTVYLRDEDGTGSLHACCKEDPGAIAYVPLDEKWQPIETVPKIHEGKVFFWCSEYGLCSGEWVSEDLDLIGWDEPDWMVTSIDETDAWDSEYGNLTHWMPRQEPPQ